MKRICIHTHTAVLLAIAKRGKQPKSPSRKEWIKKIWNTHTKEYYSDLKREKILAHVTTKMNLEDIMLREKAGFTYMQYKK